MPDGTTMAPGAAFRKTWIIRNTGPCSWPPGTELVYISGESLPGPKQIPVSPTGPGRELTISVDLTAPSRPGQYASYWRLKAPESGLFGAVVFVDIRVSRDAPAPTTIPESQSAATPTPKPPTATATPRPPTPTPSPQPPAASPTAQPTPSPTGAENPTSGCSDPDGRFDTIIEQAALLDIRVSCATGPVQVTGGSLQAFWADIEEGGPGLRFRSLVILRNDIAKIYVLAGRDSSVYAAQVTPYNATLDIDPDQQAPACAPLVPPDGYSVPTGSIGEAWCQRSLWASIGWPQQAAAEAASLEIQQTDNGLLIKAITGQSSSQVVQTTLVAIDFATMAATVNEEP